MDTGTRNHAYERRLWTRIAAGEIEIETYQQEPYTCVVLKGVPGGLGFAKYKPSDAKDGLPWSERAGYDRALGRAVANAGRATDTRSPSYWRATDTRSPSYFEVGVARMVAVLKHGLESAATKATCQMLVAMPPADIMADAISETASRAGSGR